MKSSIQNFVVFDVETTGLKKETNAIIEIACVAFDWDLKDVSDFETGVMNVYGNREIQQEALNANGISRSQIENGNDPKEQIEKLIKYFKSLKVGNSLPVLVAQNGDKFDIPFLVNMFEFFGKNLSDYVNSDFTIDTMWWGRIMWKELLNFKLGTLCSEAGVELINAHRAMADTRATADLVKIFIKNMRGEGIQTVKEKEKKFRETFEI